MVACQWGFDFIFFEIFNFANFEKSANFPKFEKNGDLRLETEKNAFFSMCEIFDNLCKFAQIVQNLSNFKKSGVFSKFQSEIAIFFRRFSTSEKSRQKTRVSLWIFLFYPPIFGQKIRRKFLCNFCTNFAQIVQNLTNCKKCVFLPVNRAFALFFSQIFKFCAGSKITRVQHLKPTGTFDLSHFFTKFFVGENLCKFCLTILHKICQKMSDSDKICQTCKKCVFSYMRVRFELFLSTFYILWKKSVKNGITDWNFLFCTQFSSNFFVGHFCTKFVGNCCSPKIFGELFVQIWHFAQILSEFVKFWQILTNLSDFCTTTNTHSWLRTEIFTKNRGFLSNDASRIFNNLSKIVDVHWSVGDTQFFFHVLLKIAHTMQMLRKHWFIINMKTVCYTLCIAYTKNVFYFFVVTSHHMHVQHVHKTYESHHFPGGFTWTKHNVYI